MHVFHTPCLVVSWLLAWVCFFLATNRQNAAGMSCCSVARTERFIHYFIPYNFFEKIDIDLYTEFVDCKSTLTNSSQGWQVFIDLMQFIPGHNFSPKSIVFVGWLKWGTLKSPHKLLGMSDPGGAALPQSFCPRPRFFSNPTENCCPSRPTSKEILPLYS